jgi:hypothetical protein
MMILFILQMLCRSDKQKMNASLADLTGRVKELSRESALQCQQMGVMQDTVSYLSACVQQAGHHSPSSGIASEGDSPSLQDNQTGTRTRIYPIAEVVSRIRIIGSGFNQASGSESGS